MKNNIYILIVTFFVSLLGYSQNTMITGTVTDQDKLPLAGVNIIVKGTSTGTMTDFDGSYSIKAKTGDILNFSIIGMTSKTITVANQTVINVTLKEDVAQLDEVVVVGYGSVAKKDLTGSVATLKAETIESVITANFDEALTGRIAGVDVSSNEGTPGEPLNIVIRGGNSITSSNSPLYVINGLPLEDFDPATISASDIETFQVLKDASATAIYGSRGANGVIVITTKSGKTNSKTEVTLDVSTSLQEITKTIDVLSPYQYVKYLETQAIAKDGYQFLPDEDGSFLNFIYKKWGDLELYRNVKGVDYQDEAFNVAHMTRANLSVRGGNDKTSVSFSSGIVNQDGVLITTGFKRWNNNFTISHQANDRLNFWGSINYANSNRRGARLRIGGSNQLLKKIILFRPVDPLNPDAGELEGEGGYIPGVNDNDFFDLFDPIRDMKGTTREDKAHNIRVNTSITYNINKDLTFKTTNGFNTTIGREELFYSLDTQQGSRSPNGINGRIDGYERSTFSSSNTLTFNRKVRRNAFNAVFGTEYVHNTLFESRLWNKNLPTDEFGINNLNIATQPTIATTNAAQNKLVSFFGRANIGLNKNKYLLTATFRGDGSSKFQGDYRWGYFPSFSGAWQVAKEGFMDNVNFINSFKIRVGWGLTGNNRVPNYASINQFGIVPSQGYVFGNDEVFQPGAIQTTFAVPDLRWETTAQTNIGVDFSIFDSRLSGTVDYYEKKTEDLLLNANMALSTGFVTVQQNVGAVSNKGFEVTLSGLVVDSKDFKWRSSINVSTNKNKILSLNDGQEFIKSNPQLGFTSNETYYISEVGQPVGMMYGLEYDGLYQVDDFIYDDSNPASPYTLKDGLPSYGVGVGPGSVKYVDQLTVDTNGDGIPDAGDGVINQNDRKTIGNPHPKHFGGFVNDFKYKNFDLSVLMQWSYDFDVFNANKALWEYPINNSFSRLAGAADAWTPWNTDTDVAAHWANGNPTYPRAGFKGDTRFIEDGSYLRLKTITLGYNLPLDAKTGFTSLRLALSGQNLVTWTNYSGFDPEVGVGSSINQLDNPSNGSLIRNLDFSAYPKNRTYSLSVQLKF